MVSADKGVRKMQKYKCIHINREKNNIVSYVLANNERQVTVAKDKLKSLIFNKTIEVVNLTLTSDGRLVEKEYKPESTLESMKKLVTLLNKYRNYYYNKSTSLISDYEYDRLFDELKAMENKTGIVLSNSPTQTVGYTVQSKLKKVKHNHPLLSLDKTKSEGDLIKFMGDKPCLLMHKLDGLTITLKYSGGKLVSAETRGNGEIGEDVTLNAQFFHIPLRIPKQELIVDGEVIMDYTTFNNINSKLAEDDRFSTPRNLAASTARTLNTKVTKERNVQFIVWKVVSGCPSNSFTERLKYAETLGFKVVDYLTLQKSNISIGKAIEILQKSAENKKIPIDGLVIGYDDIKYGESLGSTEHHLKSQLAFKFYDEEVKTVLRDVEWSMGKTGCLTPVAVFNAVDIDGTEVKRASVHNLGMVRKLKLGIGDEITVYKANQIIPQIKENLTKSGRLNLPKVCPVCGGAIKEEYNNDTLNLVCTNPDCRGKLLGKFTYFVSRDAMNIDGLSEETLQKFIQRGWLTKLSDIYKLHTHAEEISVMTGFGKKSTEKLLLNIEKSREVSLDRFINSLSIPTIGRRASKQIAEEVNSLDDFIAHLRARKGFRHIEDFGEVKESSIYNWATSENMAELERFNSILKFKVQAKIRLNSKLAGKTFVITGALKNYTNRDELKAKLESMGAKVSGSVSSKTDYLINNDISSTSGKNKKAKDLGIPIIDEAELSKLMEE